MTLFAALPSLRPDRVVSTWELRPRTREGRALFAYWQSRIPAGADMPARSHIEPPGMRDFLANVFLVDVLRHPDFDRLSFRYRLAGTGMRQIMGVEIAGKSLADALPASAVEPFERAYAAVCRRRQPLQNNGTSFWDPVLGFMQVETVLLPLAEPGEAVSMLLGLSAFET